MEDSNLIARLYPRSRLAAEYARKRENAAFYFCHKRGDTEEDKRGDAEEDKRGDAEEDKRGDTEEDKEGEAEEDKKRDAEEEEDEREESKEGLQLRFDQRRKHKQGFLVGSSQDCDIILPSSPCLITFDEHGRLVVRDLGKGHKGTRVSYDGEGGQRRSGFTWILSGERFTERRVEVGFGGVAFGVVAAAHDMSCMEYLDKVVSFTSSMDHLSKEICFGSEEPEYHHHHEKEVISSGPIHHQQDLISCEPIHHQDLITSNAILLDDAQIGDGGQAIVKRVWDVSTGRQYASKEPLTGLSSRARRRFRREAELMKSLRHANIVRFLCLVDDDQDGSNNKKEGGSSRAILEYLPLGSLDTQARHDPLTSAETLEVLKQGLAALGFLHCRDPPIAHRDIKPGNMLVASRGPLRIKLSDFGLSKPRPRRDLVTYCGTQRYMAPEIHSREKYDERVDVWSLGVVVLQYAHGLPASRAAGGWVWGMRVVEDLTEKLAVACQVDYLGEVECVGEKGGRGCPLLRFLRARMVRMEPGERGDARGCGEEAGGLIVSECCASMKTVEVDDTWSDDDEEDEEELEEKQKTVVTRKRAARAASWAPTRKRSMRDAVNAERCRKRFKTSVRSGVDVDGLGWIGV